MRVSNSVWQRGKRVVLWGGIGLAGCVEPYKPATPDSDIKLLVVDGFINPVGVSSIRLSRTQGLQATAAPPAEVRARLFIEEEGGQQYPLTETTPGTYSSAALRLASGQRVRLYLTTSNNREYASDYTPVLLTPPIDSISWKADGDKLRVYANTHDDAPGAARRFRWSYDETWEFTSRYQSLLKVSNGQLVGRMENIYRCWGSTTPSTTVLANTLNLSRNLVAEQPLVVLLKTSPKLYIKYSVLAKQYAVTPEEYSYWEILRNNTENLGSLFDPLPVQLSGNVHCISAPEERVLGFVGAQSMQEKRIFIDRRDLPPAWPLVSGYEQCGLDTIPRPHDPDPPTYADIVRFFSASQAVIPISRDASAYYYSTADCVDCRLRGRNTKPAFWP